MVTPLRVGLVAGEASGDTLGADLIQALARLAPGRAVLRHRGSENAGAPAAKSGSRPNRSRSWGCLKFCAICRGCCGCARASAAQFLAARPDVFVGIDAPEFNLGLARALARGRHPDGAVRQSAGVGLAARPGAQHSRCGRSGAVPVAVREALLRRPGRGAPNSSDIRWRMRFPSSVDRAAARAALGLGSRRPRSSPCCPGSRRGEVARLGGGLRRDGALARARSARRSSSSRRWRARRPARSSPRRCAAPRRRSTVRLIDGQAQMRADRRRRGAGRLRHGEPGGGLVASGPWSSCTGSGAMTAWMLRRLNLVKSEVFRATESTCGSAHRRRVFSGANRPGSDRSGTFDVAGRCGTARRLWSRSSWRIHRSAARRERARGAGDHALLASQATCRRSAVRPRIAGVDEAGRGPLAGPVVAAAVILRPGRRIAGIADSKIAERRRSARA